MSSAPPSTRIPASFWRQIAPCQHLLQLYQDESALLLNLERFVTNGLAEGGSAIVIGTPRRLLDLEARLRRWIPIDHARWQGRYIPLLADQTLEKFLVNDWPDEARFNQVIGEVVARAAAHGGEVRAFGEMVSLLVERGLKEATVRLEQLWSDYCQREGIVLLCAYPEKQLACDPALRKLVLAEHTFVA